MKKLFLTNKKKMTINPQIYLIKLRQVHKH